MSQRERRYFLIEPRDPGEYTPNDFVRARYDPELVSAGRTVAAWHDLLGFGEALAQTGWSLNKESDHKLLASRLRGLCQKLSESQVASEELLVLNDAALCTFSPDHYMKLSGSRFDLMRWFWARFYTHCNTTGIEHDFGLPGLRTLICEGDVIIHKWEPFQVDATDPDWTQKSPHSYLPFSLQMNTALAKCYIADGLGSKAGLNQGGVYIEKSIIDSLERSWGCKIYDDEYLFLSGEPLLAPVGRYMETKPYHILPVEIAAMIGVDIDRSAWLRLGKTIEIERDTLKFTVQEVIAYSPEDESSLYWYDCITGAQHGFDTPSQLRFEHSPPICESLSQPEIDVLTDFGSALRDFIDEHGRPPQFRNVKDEQSDENLTFKDGGAEYRFHEDSNTGLLLPEESKKMSQQLPDFHPWRAEALYGEELRAQIVRAVKRSNTTDTAYKSPFSLTLTRSDQTKK